MPFHHYSEMFRLIPRLSEIPLHPLTVSYGSDSSHNLWRLRNSILYFIPSDIPLDFTNSLLLRHSHFRRLYQPYLRPDISADSFGTHYFPTAVRSAPTFISFVFSTLLLIVLSFVLIPPCSGLGITSVQLYCLYLTIRSLVYKLGTLYYRSSAKNHELHKLYQLLHTFLSFP
ncbi:hypothetical protein BDP27DRAFT_73431 [Rhodocollybia butyracea]|uniref:Uncharacterized protein n=1 Tax=Rhodocollybia butyracea TaxID=206335 RepID=A0A9P5TWH2_9AGAR|nr:hypothetical protein BDP27DRAFT_73431 [Rhodocollybia butyracea]